MKCMQVLRAEKILEIAAQQVKNPATMQDSAELCLSDARELFAKGRTDAAVCRALKSLAYSSGVFSPAYRQASNVLTGSNQD